MRTFGNMEIWGHKSGCKLEGRLKCLGADMQQPTECRKDEGNRVRRVAPKLSSRTVRVTGPRERGSPARVLRIGQSRGSEARGGGEEGGGLVGGGARLRKGTRGKTTVVRETKGERMCAPSGVLQESPWGTLEEST